MTGPHPCQTPGDAVAGIAFACAQAELAIDNDWDDFAATAMAKAVWYWQEWDRFLYVGKALMRVSDRFKPWPEPVPQKSASIRHLLLDANTSNPS